MMIWGHGTHTHTENNQSEKEIVERHSKMNQNSKYII